MPTIQTHTHIHTERQTGEHGIHRGKANTRDTRNKQETDRATAQFYSSVTEVWFPNKHLIHWWLNSTNSNHLLTSYYGVVNALNSISHFRNKVLLFPGLLSSMKRSCSVS